MQINADTFRGGWRRWRECLRSTARWFDVDPQAAATDRQYELWACAMAPELVSLAALIARTENDPPETNRDLFSGGT